MLSVFRHLNWAERERVKLFALQRCRVRGNAYVDESYCFHCVLAPILTEAIWCEQPSKTWADINLRMSRLMRCIVIAILCCSTFSSVLAADGNFVGGGQTLQRHKNGFFQLSETEVGWIGSDEDFGLTEANTLLRVALPLGGMDNILAFQPALRTFFLNGPDAVDVPERLIDAQLNIMWRKTWSQRFQTTVWAQPKIRSDMEATKDSFFFSGGGFLRYTWVPNKFDLYLGALFLDRDDISLLPGAGFIWTPTPDWRVEALLPRPKIAKRVSQHGHFSETWAYLSGQLGGGSFAVKRDSGVEDKVTLRDFRLFFGTERVIKGGGGVYFETGYVFGRTVEYTPTDEFRFGDSVMIRLGFRY